jgi:Reverse transcriptase (RNA-dependent DNA polymerase).
MHKAWYDARQNTLAIKGRWSEEEMAMMARREAEATLDGVRFLNQVLMQYVPGRTLEAIKGCRRKSEYKEAVKKFITEIGSTPGPAPQPGPSQMGIRPRTIPEISSEDEEEEEVVAGPPVELVNISSGSEDDDREAGREPGPMPRPHREPDSGPGPQPENLKEKEKNELTSFTKKIIEELTKIPPEHEVVFHSKRLNLIVNDVQKGVSRDVVLQRLTLYLLSIFPIKEHTRRPEKAIAPVVRQNRRQKRRAEYSSAQRQWRKNSGKYLKTLLKDVKGAQNPPIDRMVPYWEEMLTTHNDVSMGRNDDVQALQDIWKPIWVNEIKDAFPSAGTAPGPDGLTVRSLKRLPLTMVQKIFLIFQYCEEVPEYLLRSYTTMIPKKAGIIEPKDYRPITVSSVLLRTYHKVFANRLQSAIPIDYRQRAFRDFDGISASTFLLDIIIRHQKQSFKPLYLASIDVAKAFDTVTHNAIADVLYNKGAPEPLINYIVNVYLRSQTALRVGEYTSHNIHPRRG